MPAAPLIVTPDLDSRLRQLIVQSPLPELGPGTVDRDTSKRVEEFLTSETALPAACCAGLWLLAGDLDRSHRISQEIETPEGSYWHCILHRREGDFGNARYWARRIGDHPVVDTLVASTPSYASAVEFIQLVERATRAGNTDRQSIRDIQWIEWQTLFEYCLGQCAK